MKTTIEYALSGIKRIEAKIDLLILGASEKHQGIYDLDFLENVFPGGFYSDPNHDPFGDRNYRKKLIKQLTDFQVNLFVKPLSRRLPPLRIEICPNDGITATVYKKFLVWLDKKIPDLKIWSVELTLDQYCYSPVNASILFRVEKKFLHFPHIKSSIRSYYKGKENFENERTRENRTLYFDAERSMKIYERGNDNNKYQLGWLFPGIDRVRMEYTARERAVGVKTLRDFIRNPQLSFPVEFKKFRPDSPFPVDGDFSEIYSRQNALWVKGEAEDPSQYVEEVKELDPLKSDLMEAMTAFQSDWNSSRKRKK